MLRFVYVARSKVQAILSDATFERSMALSGE